MGGASARKSAPRGTTVKPGPRKFIALARCVIRPQPPGEKKMTDETDDDETLVEAFKRLTAGDDRFVVVQPTGRALTIGGGGLILTHLVLYRAAADQSRGRPRNMTSHVSARGVEIYDRVARAIEGDVDALLGVPIGISALHRIHKRRCV